MNSYHGAKIIKLPDSVPVSAGGLNKTSESPMSQSKHSTPSTLFFKLYFPLLFLPTTHLLLLNPLADHSLS